jgi:WD40 repeat protein
VQETGASSSYTLEGGHEKPITALAALADGRLASASEDRTVRVWDQVTRHNIAFESHARSVTALAVLSEGILASGSEDGTVRLWDATFGDVHRGEKHSSAVKALVVLADNKVASVSTDGALMIWDTATKESRIYERAFEKEVDARCGLVVLKDGRLVSSLGNGVGVWDLCALTLPLAPWTRL